MPDRAIMLKVLYISYFGTYIHTLYMHREDHKEETLQAVNFYWLDLYDRDA